MLSKIINRISQPRKHPVVLGDIYVSGRSDFKKFLEFNSDGENSPEELKEWIKNLLEVPVLDKDMDLARETLVLDVAIRKYQAGTDMALYTDPLVPFLWRQSINIDVRLRDYYTNKTLAESSFKRTMSWREFFGRLFSLRSIFSMRSTFASNDLKILLAKSLVDSLVWAKKCNKL